MNDVDDRRKEKRYPLFEHSIKLNNVFTEIILHKLIRTDIIDISMNGLCFEIKSPNPEEQRKIEEADSFFIKIHLIENVFLVKVKKTWCVFLDHMQETVYKGGLLFNVITPDDRLILENFLDNIEKECSTPISTKLG